MELQSHVPPAKQRLVKESRSKGLDGAPAMPGNRQKQSLFHSDHWFPAKSARQNEEACDFENDDDHPVFVFLMNIPPPCSAWQQQMGASAETQRILQNVVSDTCLPDLEAPFFSAIAAHGTPLSPNEARQISKGVVDSDFDGFACKGNQIPNENFQQLIRVSNGKGFTYALPQDEREDLLERFTVTDAEIENISYERLTDLVNAYAAATATYIGPVTIRGKDDLAWASDRAAFPPTLPPWPDLVRELGLPHLTSLATGVVFTYPRDETGRSLHIPRAFDGIDWPPFRLEMDCTAPSGTTDPLEGRSARPEAVHRGCQIGRNQLIFTAWH